MKVSRRQFFQAEAMFVFLDQVLHGGMLQLPFEQVVCRRQFVVGHNHLIMKVQFMLLVFAPFAIDDVAIRARPLLRAIAALGHLRQFVAGQVLPLRFGNRRNRGQQRRGLIGRDAEEDVAGPAKGDDLPIVQATIGPQFLGQIDGQAFHGGFQTPFELARRQSQEFARPAESARRSIRARSQQHSLSRQSSSCVQATDELA